MLLKNFYTILSQSGPEAEVLSSGAPAEKYRFTLELNPAHPVYEGHFSGNPVVPGVCQVQMVSELISGIRGKELRLFSADNIKFMTMIIPENNSTIEAELQVKTSENGISANAILRAGENVFIKFRGLYREETD